jgi:AcrR family transcriptional regulator
LKKEDLRIIKTKQSIKDSFIELVKEKGYNKVSVTDIVNKANINRNTFYLHYEDKEDLIKQLLNDSAVKIGSLLGYADFLKHTNFSNISELQIRWGLRIILKNMEDELDLFKTVLNDISLQGYFDHVLETMKLAIAELLDVNNPKSNLVFEYTMSGIFGLVKQWIKNPSISTSEVAKILAQLSYAGLVKFNKVNK